MLRSQAVAACRSNPETCGAAGHDTGIGDRLYIRHRQENPGVEILDPAIERGGIPAYATLHNGEKLPGTPQ